MTEVTTTRVAPEGNPEVAAKKAAFERRVEDIRNHPDWSDEAKKRYLAEAYEAAMEKHDQLIAESKRVEEEKIAKLEQEVFAVPMPLAATIGEKISTRPSYRDASFRVLDALDKVAVGDRQRVLSDLMERATRVGEDLLEVACYHIAVERGYWDVSNAYRAKHPEAAKKWEAYSGARQVKEGTTSQLFRSVSGELTRHPRSHHVRLRSGRKVG